MIIITLGPERKLEAGEDDLGRDRVGYNPTMSPGALYDANHGMWHLGERASRENALVAFEGTVVQAIGINHIEPVAGTYAGRETSKRSVIHGDILTDGHPVHDRYVGHPSPVHRVVRQPPQALLTALRVRCAVLRTGQPQRQLRAKHRRQRVCGS
jgi:hypothetical protein